VNVSSRSLKIQRTSTQNKLNPGSVASYDLRPGNRAGPYSGRYEIEEKVRHIKKEEGKIQIGKVSKHK